MCNDLQLVCYCLFSSYTNVSSARAGGDDVRPRRAPDRQPRGARSTRVRASAQRALAHDIQHSHPFSEGNPRLLGPARVACST